jgi:MFS family permease
MQNLDPLLLSLLLLLIGLLAVLSSILSNKLSAQHSSSTSVYLIFILAVACAALLTFAGWLVSSPSANKSIYYWVLGIGFAFSLLTVIVLLRTRPKPGSSSTPTTEAPFNRQNVQNRYKLLEDVKREVEGRLESSLHDAVLINLLKEKQNQLVACKWAIEVKIGNQPTTQLDYRTDIIEVFDQKAIAGKLLILGAPGAGKTTTLLEIASELCDRALNHPDEPIPVLFNLSAWKDDKQAISGARTSSFADWLVAELNDKRGVRVDIGKHWLENHQILPLLDGLDELEPTRQERCVQAINQFLEQAYCPKHLVVCSRRDEYEHCNTQLQLNGAVCLQPLTSAQIHDYLVDVGRPELWQSIKDDPEQLNLVKTPLLLSIMTLAYEEISIEEWHKCNSPEALRQYLFDAYIERMLKREIKHRWYAKGKEPSPEQTKHWLVWLTLRLLDESRDEFLIEKIQPSWLQTPIQKQIYHIGIGLLSGLIIGFIGGLEVEFTSNDHRDGLILGLIIGPMSGLIIGFREKIKPIETVKWSGMKVGRGIIFGLILGLIFGLISWPTFTLIHTSNITWSFDRLIYAPSFGLFGGLIGALIGGLSGPDIEKRTVPNQGIWQSAVNTGIFALVCWLIFGLIFVLIRWLIARVDVNGYTFISSGLLGLLIGGIVPGTACIQHLTLRLILWQNGYIPWNYARFLNYATERMLLQRVGGRYRFIHDLLREHFAQIPPTTVATSPRR